MNERQYHEAILARLNQIEDMLVEIRDKISNPDYNISLTIPKQPDCAGCQTIDPITNIPWE